MKNPDRDDHFMSDDDDSILERIKDAAENIIDRVEDAFDGDDDVDEDWPELDEDRLDKDPDLTAPIDPVTGLPMGMPVEDDRDRMPYSEVERRMRESGLEDDPYKPAEKPDAPDAVGFDERAPEDDPSKAAESLERPERYVRDQR